MKSFVFFIFFCLFLLFLGRNLSFLPVIDFEKEKTQTAQVKDTLQGYLVGKNGTFSVYVKSLKTGDSFGINENRVLTAASLNKLYIISYLYYLAEKDEIDLEEKIVIQKEDMQDYGTGIIRYQKPGKTYSLKTLAQLALEKSDNTAAYVLGVRIGIDEIQDYVESLGFVSTDMEENKTTAKEAGKILEMIYKNKISSQAYSKEMLDFMKDTDFEDRLPRYLDKKISVHHKIGDAVGMVHDAGIIDDGKNPLIVAVMTSEITDEEEGKETIGRIAELVYKEQD